MFKGMLCGIVVLGLTVAVLDVPTAHAGVWKATPPKPTDCRMKPGDRGCQFWQATGGAKQGVPALIGQWNQECRQVAGGSSAYVSVYEHNPVWVHTQCYVLWNKTRG